VDRCALFVDAGYVLADGAMAAHGTTQRESVSWDYAGLLQFFAGLSADRTGQQLLRCYWYEATVDGRRSPEHDTLADLPGLTLRLSRMRPGKREGVETEIHRDLTTLARNRAISDALLLSAEEDLAHVIEDVQDLGVRVTIVHISVDGNWTISRSLRQQCDDIVEIDGTQLRPHVQLLAGAEPARYTEQYAATGFGGKPLANGHAASIGGTSHAGLSSGSAGSHPAPPAIYTAPVVADYPPAAQPAADYPPAASPAADYQPPARAAALQSPAPSEPEPAPAAGTGPAEPNARGTHRSHAAASPQQLARRPAPAGSQPPAVPSPVVPPAHPPYAAAAPASFLEPGPGAAVAPAVPATQDRTAGHHGSPAGVPVPPGPAGSRAGSSPPAGQHASRPRPPYAPSPGDYAEPAGSQFSSAPPDQFGGAPPGLPTRRGSQANGLPSGSPGQRGPLPQRSQQATRGQQAARAVPAPAAGYVPQQGPYDAEAAVGPPGGGTLTDTVQAAHSEGFDFGESVAREAPALWLEAVVARKPRMPSDLEARLLQGSALPIDSLLHDEVRQALRRGFWDALERSRG
jgi:uncharacterized LabA/DUF88 family protein